MNNELMFSSESGEWSTPQDFYNDLDSEFHFELDPAATADNAKNPVYYTKEQDGLSLPWAPARVFVNPPYGRGITGLWVKKAHDEWLKGALVVMLLPARTDTRWFHDWILGKAEIQFVRGRLKFGGCKDPAPFPSMVVIYRPIEVGIPHNRTKFVAYEN